MNIINSNNVFLKGIVAEPFVFSNSVMGEDFYTSRIKVPRLSGTDDYIPVMVAKKMIDISNISEGSHVQLQGSFRSHNEGPRLLLYAFADAITVIEGEYLECNYITFDGYICRPTNYRETSNGKQITDIFVAINRNDKKCDYIPCISWGRNALYADMLEVGDHIQCEGRIQSRPYLKNGEMKIAYEVSLNKIDFINEKGDLDDRD